MSQKILFATNRSLLPATGALPNFSDLPIAPGAAISCALATVEGTDSSDQDSGVVTQVTPLVPGAFAAADLQPLLHSSNDILVLIHGAGNAFTDSMTRAAYNQKWLSEVVGKGGLRKSYDVIAFSWPARNYVLQGVSALVDGITDYDHDRDSASSSGGHIGQFFKLLYALRGQIGARRMNLLAHSMGCYALGFAVEQWYGNTAAPTQMLFDEIILAAGDEVSTTFTEERGGRLSDLPRLGREITIYFNRNDILMHLSRVVNHLFHLGYEGPPGMADLSTYPAKIYDFVNCIGLTDYLDTPQHPVQIDHTHQYYRESPTVRADIAATLAGLVPVRSYFYQNENFHSFVKVDFSGQS